MEHRPTFDLLPATREDIPRLSHIHAITCLPDNAFKLYFPTAAEFEERVTAMLEGQVGDPSWQHINAVDKKTGELAAWASWNTLTDAEIRERDEKAAAKESADVEKGKLGKGELDFPPGLPMFVQADTDRWLERWTRGQRHVQCKALFTDPLFQGQGMGNALVEHGNRIADAAGLPIFLQASPYGYPIYEKHGFETVQFLDVDLREWAKGAKGGDKGFGPYRFRYMLRLPRTLPAS